MFGNSNDIRINVTAETRQAQQAFTGLFQKFGEFAFHANNIVYWGKMVFGALEDIYKVAREGADVIGGEVKAAYDEFDENLKRAEESAKSLLANALLPLIKGYNEQQATLRGLDDALAAGVITQQEYNQAITYGQQGIDVYTGLTDEQRAAVETFAEAARDAANAVRELTKAELAHINFQTSSWDKAMMVSAGLIESTVNPALIAQQEETARAQAAWGLLAQQIAGPFGAAADSFAEKNAALVERIAEIKAEIADLGGLQYITPEQSDQILELRDKLIGVSMEIHAIDEEFGEAFDAGKQGRRVQAAADTLEGLRQDAWALEQQIIALGSKPYVTATNLERIGELQEELGETEQAIKDLQAAQEEQTRQMLLGMLQQSLALDGLTVEEVGKLNEIALAWGLIDQATYDAQQTALEATELINNDANLAEILDKLNEMEGIHFVNIVFTVTGQELLDAARDDLEAMQDTHVGVDVTPSYGAANSGGAKAMGGPVSPDVPYWVGEHGPEMFTPDTAGTITPNNNINVAAPQVVVYLDSEEIAARVLEQAGGNIVRARSSGGGYTGR